MGGGFLRISSTEIPGGESLIVGDLGTPWEINEFRPDIPKQGLASGKIEN